MAEERHQRRLAAILSADVAGYSRLMGIDEAGTLARLNAFWRELIDPTIAAHSGRIVKLMGDGALVEFASAVDAVSCAIEIQRQIQKSDAGSSKADLILFRIGIHVGDVIIEREDIYGDGVNIAARLEEIAEPGGISISEDAWRQVQGKVPANFIDTGEQSLKNIARPVRVYRVQLDKESSISAAKAPLSSRDKPSIAVLPFQNLSGDSEQDYFCDGLVDDILISLSKLAGMRVIARNSSFVYKGRSVDVREAARQLDVRYVLEGSVRKSGNRIRITAQLIDAKDGTHLWAERYDRAIDDIFAIQDEITLVLATEMQVKLPKENRHGCVTQRQQMLRLGPIGHRACRISVNRCPRNRSAPPGCVGKKHLRLIQPLRPSMECSVRCIFWTPVFAGGTTAKRLLLKRVHTLIARLNLILKMLTHLPHQASP